MFGEFIIKSSIACLILNIILNYILIQDGFLGIRGPAIATVISLYFISFIQLNHISKEFNLKLGEVFPWLKLIKLMAISLLSAFIITQIKFIFLNLSDNNLFNNITIVLIGLCFYSILFVIIGMITKVFNNKLKII